MTTFSDTYDTATPLGSDAPSVIDDRITEAKAAVQERENVDHYWPLTGTQVSDASTGEHRKVTLRVGSAPTQVADKGIIYAKDVSGKAELFYIDEDGDEVQITTGGIVKLTSTALLGILANNTYLTAVDAAGTGTVDLIKANASDVAVLPDGSELATSGAPTADADIANKKYVDDNIGSANYTPADYANAASKESITFPNGFIMKMGYTTIGATSGTVTFGTAFPNACVSVSFTVRNDAAATGPVGIRAAVNAANFTWGTDSAAYTGFYWIAVGY